MASMVVILSRAAPVFFIQARGLAEELINDLRGPQK